MYLKNLALQIRAAETAIDITSTD